MTILGRYRPTPSQHRWMLLVKTQNSSFCEATTRPLLGVTSRQDITDL